MRYTGIIAVVALTFLAGCSASDDSEAGPSGTVTETVTVEASPETGNDSPDDESATEEEPAEEAVGEPQLKDFELRVKITDKQCFGSAGCSIDYDVIPAYTSSAGNFDDLTFDLTYEIKGDESGPIVGTLEFAEGQYTLQDGSASTSGNQVELVATPTEIFVY